MCFFRLIGSMREGGKMSKETNFIGTKEVAKMLDCSLPTARNIMHRTDFPLIRVGKNLKVNEQAFIDWSKNRRM